MQHPPAWVLPAHVVATVALVAGLLLDWDGRGRRSSFELFASIERLGVGAAGFGVYLLAFVPPLAAASAYALSVGSRRWYRVAAWVSAGVVGAVGGLVAVAPIALGPGVYCALFAATAVAGLAAWPWRPAPSR